MKVAFYIFSLFLALGRLGFAQTPSPANPDALQTRIKAHINQPRFAHAQWGIKVVSLQTGNVLFEHNPDKLMAPASNAKLFTCALALDRLGADYRIKTSVKSIGLPDTNGVLHGDLVTYGRGDASISARFNNGSHTNLLKPLVDSMVAAGIKRIDGDLVGDQSYFRNPPHGSGWGWDDFQWAYGAPVSALSLDDNVISLVVKPAQKVGEPCQIFAKTNLLSVRNLTKTTSRVSDLEIYRPIDEKTVYVTGGLPVGGASYADFLSIPDPALWFVIQLKEALAQRGVTVAGRLRTVDWLEPYPAEASKMHEIATVESHPLKEIVKETMKTSQNLYAQLLLLQVGAVKGSPAKQSLTQQAGLSEMRKFLDEAGIKPEETLLKDGPGLAAGSLVTPNAVVSLLTFMARHRYASIYADTLPIAGVDGTLKERFKNTAAQGHVWAKTGTKEFTSALSGYAVTKNNERIAFAVILNNHKETSGNPSPRSETDAVVQMLAEY